MGEADEADGILRIVSWNINGRKAAWQNLVNSPKIRDSDPSIDVALLQEAKQPPPNVPNIVQVSQGPWHTCGTVNRPWRAAVARLSERVTMMPRPVVPLEVRKSGEVGVSRTGTLAVADVRINATEEVITVASMYGAWEDPALPGAKWIYADASVHRVISDLSVLIDQSKSRLGRLQATEQKIIVAGDLNLLYSYGENGDPYWRDRYATVFARMAALGLPFVGPQAPDAGCQASPWPKELPLWSRNVPTFRTKVGATRQLDFVFASHELRSRLVVRALNEPNEWGPSDHCRVLIELRPK